MSLTLILRLGGNAENWKSQSVGGCLLLILWWWVDCCVFASLHLHPATMLMGAGTRHCLSWNLIPSSWQPNWDLYCSDCLSFVVNYLLPFCTLRQKMEVGICVAWVQGTEHVFPTPPLLRCVFSCFHFQSGMCTGSLRHWKRAAHMCSLGPCTSASSSPVLRC